jgi:hypothetical protein
MVRSFKKGDIVYIMNDYGTDYLEVGQKAIFRHLYGDGHSSELEVTNKTTGEKGYVSVFTKDILTVTEARKSKIKDFLGDGN